MNLPGDSKASQPDPWDLVWGQPYIDAEKLSSAIEWELQHNLKPDFRTRLLIHDALDAIQSFWGKSKFTDWLEHTKVKEQMLAIIQENFGETGFGKIRSRLVTSIKRDQLEQVFELVGKALHKSVEIYIAGSIPTLLEGLTSRPTDDIDFVDEVPEVIRSQREMLNRIENKYGLSFGHVQSHYLPANWESRRHFLGDFGRLRVYLVDSYDIFVSKLSSRKEKHQDNLQVLAGKLNKEKARERLLNDGKAFLERPSDRAAIEENWKFIFRESLFS